MTHQRRSIEEKQAVVAYAKAHGVKAAADHYGLHPNSVTSWKHGRNLGSSGTGLRALNAARQEAAAAAIEAAMMAFLAPRPRCVPPKSPRSPEPFERTPVDHQWLRERAITGMWRSEIA